MVYNLMTCEGFGTSILGGCSMAWITIAILVFIGLIVKKQYEDGILSGLNFNFIGSAFLGLGSAIVILYLFGEARWAFLAGILGIGIGGYVGGLILGGSRE